MPAISPNQITLQSYETGIDEYRAKTPAETSGDFKSWINTTLTLLPTQARIIEIGSGFGRDARYIESQGFAIERTDAAQGFVKLLQDEGYKARIFNILTDVFTTAYDLILANGVFHHFTRIELQHVLEKIRTSLTPHGLLSFSVKEGNGEEWITSKLGNPVYFCYWNTQGLSALLTSTGFEVLRIIQAPRFLCIIARAQ